MGFLEFSKPGFNFGMKRKMQPYFLTYYDVYLSERDLQWEKMQDGPWFCPSSVDSIVVIS